MTEPLFPGYEPAAPPEHVGRDARVTARQKALIEQGIHPATRRRIPDTGMTCGDCAHLWRKDGRWFKCDVTLWAYDMRKWWPACDRFQEAPSE